MGLFADDDPGRRGAPPSEGLVTRAATPADLAGLAAIRAARDGTSEAEAASALERQFAQAGRGDAAVLVAVVDGRLAGYGVAARLDRPGVPEGWYLGGVVVAPEHRRRGLGARLTRERLAWIAGRARRAYDFVNERNRASIDLHAPFGFREVARDLEIPGVTFTGGRGLLFAAELAPP